MDGRSSSGRVAVEVLGSLAAALASEGRYHEAIASARQALQYRPDSATTYFDVGTAFLKAGQFEEALACYRQALVLRSDDPDTPEQPRHFPLGTRPPRGLRFITARAGSGSGETIPRSGTTSGPPSASRAGPRKPRPATARRSRSGRTRPKPRRTWVSVLSDLGHLDEEEARIREALRQRPSWPVALDNLGTTLVRRGKAR